MPKHVTTEVSKIIPALLKETIQRTLAETKFLDVFLEDRERGALFYTMVESFTKLSPIVIQKMLNELMNQRFPGKPHKLSTGFS